MGGNGESNIDVTLATRNMDRYVKAWIVDSSCSTSDHNLVIIEIDGNNNCGRNWKPDHGYNVRKADWMKFGRSVEQNFSDEVLRSLSTLPVDKAVRVFNEKLDKCCKSSIPRRKMTERTVPWWNSQLTNFRKKVMAAKKQLLRAKRLHLADVISEYVNTYRRLRNLYVSNIKKLKLEAWQRFVEEEGNKDPWGIVYKIVKEKTGKPIIWTALRLSDGSKTTCLDDTIEALLDKCVPKDEITQLNVNCRSIKQRVDGYKNMNMEPIISYKEINMAISTFKNKKAPGMDNFKIEIVKELWRKTPEAIHGLMNNCLNQGMFPKLWKVANLRILLKDESKDRT